MEFEIVTVDLEEASGIKSRQLTVFDNVEKAVASFLEIADDWGIEYNTKRERTSHSLYLEVDVGKDRPTRELREEMGDSYQNSNNVHQFLAGLRIISDEGSNIVSPISLDDLVVKYSTIL